MTMGSIDIRLDSDGAFKDWVDKPAHHFTSFRMTGLKDGTQGGKPTLMFAHELEDGSVVYLETTLALIENALRAFKIRWGLPIST